MSFNPGETTRIIVKRVRRRVVKDWRSRLRDYSTIALAATAALGGAMPVVWNGMPAEWKASIPKDWLPYLGAVFGILGLWGAVGKVIIQGPLPPEDKDQPGSKP